jgi:hypothetical protein
VPLFEQQFKFFATIMQSNVILSNMIFEYTKFVELAIVFVLRNVDDKHTFSTINYMKSKLRNRLATNLDLVVRMHAQDVFTLQKISIPCCHHKLEWGKILVWVGVITFKNNFMIRLYIVWYLHESYLLHLNKFIGPRFFLSILLFVDMDLDTNMFCFVGSPSITIEKSLFID